MSIWSLLGLILLLLIPLIVSVFRGRLFIVSRRPLFRFGQESSLFSTDVLLRQPEDKLLCPEEELSCQLPCHKEDLPCRLPWQLPCSEEDLPCPEEELPWQLPWPKEEANKSHKNQGRKDDNIVRAGLFRPDLHGMDDYEIKVLEFIEHGTATMLGICGMRGVGKTTLLKLVRTCYRQQCSFRYVFYADAGNGFTADMLRDVLGRNIGLGPMPAVNRISSFLEDESFLLLLDDVSASFDLSASGLPMTLGPRQKVIFTTRNEAVCAEMGCAGNTIHMYCLVGNVAWNLFKYNVGDEIIDSDPEIKYLAKQMVAKCRGFPSALCTVGLSMSTKKDVKEWIFAHEMLIKSSPSNEIQDTDNEGYPCLQFFEDEF